jgi:NAD(P)-dependent dehydrogenase (short-subunit alcohol dehydrogenase family)
VCSGIGLQVLKTLAGASCNVAMHGLGDRTQCTEMLRSIKSEHNVDVFHSDADLLQPAQIREMVADVHRHFGRIDILVNNAGIQHVRCDSWLNPDQAFSDLTLRLKNLPSIGINRRACCATTFVLLYSQSAY